MYILFCEVDEDNYLHCENERDQVELISVVLPYSLCLLVHS